jgi:hypothetical protein
MIAATNEYQAVESLMGQRHVDLEKLVVATGVEPRVVAAAIAHQRYTPSPEQRERVSTALRFPRDRIVWGHRTAVEEQIHSRL